MKKIYTVLSVLLALCGALQVKGQSITPGDPGNFITTWKTDNNGTSNDDQITIPTYSGGSYSYNYNIYWEKTDDASISGTETGVTGSITLTFPSSGTYRVEINGDFPRIYFNNGGDKDKILTIDQWGSIQWKSMRNAFYGAKNMQLTTTVAPDLSQVSDMSWMFRDTETFDQDLSSWDVSKVSSMQYMFSGAIAFNSPLDDWNPGIDLADGCSLTSMFRDTEVFDQDLSSWDVSKVTSMAYMFHGAKAFNSPLDNWEPGIGLTDGCDLYSMFHDTEVFDQDLSSWDVSKVSTMQNMFHGANAFNSSLISWRPGIGLTDGCSLHSMFRDTETFNQDLSSWDVSKVSTMRNMFYGAKAFNSPLTGWKPGIDLTDGCDLYSMFHDTEIFDQDLSSWDVSKVRDMSSMFRRAKAFNSPLVGWKPGIDLADGCSLSSMFRDTETFNQDLSSWDISSVTNMSAMFNNSALSVANYDATLIGWAAQSDIPQNLILGAIGLKYCQSQAARQSLIDNHGWTINGDTEECFAFTPSADNILYVNQSVNQTATGYTGSGNSWANAIPELADALQWAREQHDADNDWLQNDSLRVYVAKGKYLPKYKLAEQDDGSFPTTDRDKSFLMVKNVQLYGGFPDSGNSDFADRDWESYETILSGDLGTPGDDSDNAYHVVVSVGEVGNALLDGFSIQDGNADRSNKLKVYGVNIERRSGGGIYNHGSSPELKKLKIIKNNSRESGGGIYNLFSSPVLVHVEIIENSARYNGGGVYSRLSSPSFINTVIKFNVSERGGGGIYNYDAFPEIRNSLITDNYAEERGGGIYNQQYADFDLKMKLINVTIANNHATQGGGICNYQTSPELINSLVFGNGENVYNYPNTSEPAIPVFKNSLIEGSGGSDSWDTAFGTDGGDNMDSDPLFTDGANGDYTLADNSPAINAGNNTYYTDAGGDLANDLDLAGNPRLVGTNIDMGAYENQAAVNSPPIIITSGGTTTFTRLSSGSAVPVAIDDALTVSDLDNTTLASATVAITSNFQNGEDILDFVNDGIAMGNISGNYDNVTGVLTLTSSGATATLSEWQETLRTVTYHNTSAAPNTNSRTITFVVNDGQDDSVPATKNIEIEVKVSHIIPSADNILYVNQSVDQTATSYTGSGDSWVNAIPELKDALNWATANKNQWISTNTLQIWVAQGEYQPGSGQSFKMLNHVEIYGGFNATETDVDDRDWNANTTTIKGNNSRVFFNIYTNTNKLTNSAVLNGFTITGGNTTGYGGGMYNEYASPVLTHVTLSGNGANFGGGMYNVSSSPVLTNVTLSGNTADYEGGGMCNVSSSPVLTNVRLSDNTAADLGGGMHNRSSSPVLTNVTLSGNEANNGGGMHNRSSSPVLTNVTLSGNEATNGGGMYNLANSSPVLTNVTLSENTANINGGGMYNNYSSSSLVLINVTISGNTAGTNGGGMYNNNSSPKLYNSIVWGNTIHNYDSSTPEFYNSLVQGSGGSGSNWVSAFGTDGGDNMDSDPLFTDGANGDYSLQACSPAVNAGSNSHYAGLDGDTKDLAGNPRVYDFDNGGIIDMGAYEFQGEQIGYDNVVFEDTEVTYDGTAHTLTATNLPAGITATYTIQDKETNVVAEAVDAGTYTVVATLSGCGPDKVLTATLTITQATLTVVADDNQSKVYGEADPVLTYTVSGFQGSDDESMLSGSLHRTAGEDVGTYPIDQGDLSAGANYDIDFTGTDFKITKATLTVIADSGQSKVYGEVDPVLTYTASGFQGSDDETVLTGSLSRTAGEDVGTYPIDQGDLSAGDNYDIDFTGADFEITKATITGITFENASFTYAGTSKSLVIAGTLPTGTSVSYTGNDQTDAGSYTVAAEIDGGNNYEDLTLTAQLTIEKAPITGITFDDASFTYDGTAKSLAIAGTLPTGTSVSYTGNDQTDAGSYTVAAEIDGGNNYEDLTLTAQLTIEKASVAGITFDGASFTYDGTVKSLAIAGTLPTGTSVSYTGNDQTDAGSYTVAAEIDGGTNYEDLTLTAQLTIEKAPIAGITLNEASFTYDGTVKSLAIAGTLPTGTSVSYTNNDQTDAGSYTVSADINGGNNYLSKTQTAKLTIDKAALPAFTFADASFTYDGTAKALEVIGLPAGASVSYTDNAQTNTGVYTVTAHIDGGNNYTSETQSAKLTIKPLQQVLRFSAIAPVARDVGTLHLDISSNSELPIQVFSDNQLVAEVQVGSELLVKGVGHALIRAEQAGDANHIAAKAVEQLLEVLNEQESKLPVRVHPAVSPNGDGINEFLRIEGIEQYPENKLVVFDANGVVIQRFEGYDNASKIFDGTKAGRAVPNGTYFYVLEVKVDGQWLYDKGYFVVRQ